MENGHVEPSRVVVAYDGLPASDLAVEFGCRLAQSLNGRLDLVHIVEEGMIQYVAEALKLDRVGAAELCRARKTDVFARAAALCQRTMLDGSQKGPLNPTTALFEAKTVVEGVMEYAHTNSADLVVVQPSPHLEELRLNIINRLMEASPVPLLVVQANRQTPVAGNLPTVLIPLDERLQSVLAACFGIRLAAAAGYRVVFGHVQVQGNGNKHSEPSPLARSMIALAEGVASKFSVPSEVKYVTGPAADLALIQLGILQRAHFFVMRRSATTIVGSTTDLLLRNSRQNVLLINEAHCLKCDDCPVGRFTRENDEASH